MRSPIRFRRKPTDDTSSPRKSRVLQIVQGSGLFLLGLLCSFYLAFPNTLLKERLVSELETRLPVEVELEEAALRPLLTLTGEQMGIRLSEQPEVSYQIDRFLLGPRWGSVLVGDPGIDGKLDSASGELSFSWQRSGPLSMTAVDLPFDVPLATRPAISLSGNISTGTVTTSLPLQSVTESQVDMSLGQVSVKGLEVLTASTTGLRLGELTVKITGQGTSFSIARLETSGGDLLASGSGRLMLVTANPRNSRINLNLSVRAADGVDPTLVSLLELVGTQQSDGSRKLQLTGTLAKPIIR